MKQISRGAALLLAAGAFALARPTAVLAQTKDSTKAPATSPDTATPAVKAAGGISVAVEAGGQDWDRLSHVAPNEQQLGKLLEYRDIKTGLVIPQFLLRYTPKDSVGTYQIEGRNLLQLDQSFWARASQPGLYDAQVRYDGIVHTFSTDARALGTFGNGNLYALPSPRPDSNAWRAAPYLSPIRTIWDPLKMSFALTPTPAWDFKAEYTHIAKAGDRPMGMAFGSSSNNTREILEPIDQTVQDFRVLQSYSKPRFTAAATYDFSMFQNAYNSVSSNNPQQTADTPAAGAAVGRTALAPNNSAQAATVVLAGNFPWRTRVMASGSYSWWRQNEPFIPVTTNSFLINNPLYAVPRTSLDGQAGTSMVNASVNSHPLKDLTLTLRARSFQYRNSTPPFAVANLVISDRSVEAGDTSAAKPFTKTNGDFSAGYRLPANFNVTASYSWEQWLRDTTQRNVHATNEVTPKISLDYMGVDWLTLRASYLNGSRRGSTYVQNLSTENPDFRRFDEADRNRERTNFEVEVTPVDELTFSLTWEIGHDGYPNSTYGVQSDKSIMAGGSVEWTPSKRFMFNLGYSREDYNDLLQQLYRTGSTAATLDNPTWAWTNNNTDHINTTYAGFTAVLDPGKWEAGGTLSMSDATFLIAAYNPVTPTGGTAAQNLSATATNFPAVTQQLHPGSLFLRYIYSADWALTLRYQQESYNQNDYRTQTLTPAIGTTANHINLASYYQNYDVGWWTILISWHPSLLKYGTGRSTL
jgi:MtrB/PioB family decaheme-associated outer membrane protein